MAMIEEVLVPLYLHHRYAVEAAASALGGQNYIYAMRGDGREPVEWVPAAAQKAALDALIATLKPSELALSRAVLSKIPPRPAGYPRTRELFPRNTGGAFDPITPAASPPTDGRLHADERCARRAWSRRRPSIRRCRASATSSIASSPRRSTRRRGLVLQVGDPAIDRAGRGEPADRSRRHGADVAGARDRGAEAEGDSGAREPRRRSPPPTCRRCSSSPATSIGSSSGRPNPRAASTPPGTPPGAPIGEPPFSYLRGEEDCIWIK